MIDNHVDSRHDKAAKSCTNREMKQNIKKHEPTFDKSLSRN